MSLFSRARKHIDMNRVKELREEKVRKIKHEKAAEIWKQQENYFAELKEIEQKEDSRYSNWRKELKEGMTTAGLGMINYPAEGDNNLENITQTAVPGTAESGGSGGSYSFGNYDGTGNGGFVLYLDTRKYDTLKFSASNGNATRIEVSVGGGGYQTLSNGTNRITISSANRGQNVLFLFNASKSGGSGATGASISGVTFQRRYPINVFVGLDDPEANSFIRMGDMNNLSAEERRKKLKDMLDAGNEFLSKYTNITPNKTSPGDIELASADPLSNPPGGVQGTAKNYTYDDHMKTWVPNISDVEKRAGGGKSKFRNSLGIPLK